MQQALPTTPVAGGARQRPCVTVRPMSGGGRLGKPLNRVTITHLIRKHLAFCGGSEQCWPEASKPSQVTVGALLATVWARVSFNRINGDGVRWPLQERGLDKCRCASLVYSHRRLERWAAAPVFQITNDSGFSRQGSWCIVINH